MSASPLFSGKMTTMLQGSLQKMLSEKIGLQLVFDVWSVPSSNKKTTVDDTEQLKLIFSY